MSMTQATRPASKGTRRIYAQEPRTAPGAKPGWGPGFGVLCFVTQAEIVGHVKFLTGKKGIFKYGGIDLAKQTYDVQRPYGAPFYPVVMRKQWFDNLKAEEVRTSSFERYIDSPVPTLTIITGAMENSLKEWATGVRIQIKFTEEEFAPRYQHHRAALLTLQTRSPTWFGNFQRELYSQIVSTSNFAHLKRIISPPDENELDGVDFDALEASVTAQIMPDAVPDTPSTTVTA